MKPVIDQMAADQKFGYDAAYQAARGLIGMAPILGTALDAVEAVTGVDQFTGEELSDDDRAGAMLGATGPALGVAGEIADLTGDAARAARRVKTPHAVTDFVNAQRQADLLEAMGDAAAQGRNPSTRKSALRDLLEADHDRPMSNNDLVKLHDEMLEAEKKTQTAPNNLPDGVGPDWKTDWTPPKNWNRPVNHGEWAGPRGNGSWIDDRPEVIRVVGVDPATGKANQILFYKGEARFSKYAQETFDVKGLVGTKVDSNADHQERRHVVGWPMRTTDLAGRDWLRITPEVIKLHLFRQQFTRCSMRKLRNC